MRREGFELSVSPPVVIYKGQGSERQEPMEEVVCEVEDQYTGPLIEAMSARKVCLVMHQVWGGQGCLVA